MNAGEIRAATVPLLALGMIPQAADHLPACPAIGRTEEPAGERATPDDARLIAAAGCECPDTRRAPIDGPAPHIVFLVTLGLGRIDRHGDLFPSLPVRAVKLHSEMTVIERGVMAAVARVAQRKRDIVAEEIDGLDVPFAIWARHREQTFTGRNKKLVAHDQPPESA
jgi:hypothetical protein